MTSSTEAAPAPGPGAAPVAARAPGGVRVAGLTVAFGERRVLDDVSLEVAPGACVAVVGPSGCGKSTLLRVLAGLPAPGAWVAPEARVTVPITDAGARDVAWMPQGDSLLPWRRTLANVALGARVAGGSRRDARAQAEALLDRFGLAASARAWPHELSGGMRQRAALARTALARRRVLLLDEPFGALDALTRRDLNAWLDDRRRDGSLGCGVAVVLVTHDVDEAVGLADQVVVLGRAPARVVARVDVGVLGEPAARRVVLAALG